MLVDAAYAHIEKAEDQPAHLRLTPRVRVAQIVMDYLAYGWSVDEMCRQHPYLTPAEAHAAMGYYFDHQEEIDGEIEVEVKEAADGAKIQRPLVDVHLDEGGEQSSPLSPLRPSSSG